MNETTQLIDLAGFRKKYGLKQKDVGDLIGTSGSFISLVEKGTSRLPDDKLKMLISKTKGKEGLVPCYDRLENLQKILLMKRYISKESVSQYPFEKELTTNTIIQIMLGKSGITNEMATKIIESYPMVNSDWLMFGQSNSMMNSVQFETMDLQAISLLQRQNEEIIKKLDKTLSMISSFINVLKSGLEQLQTDQK